MISILMIKRMIHISRILSRPLIALRYTIYHNINASRIPQHINIILKHHNAFKLITKL